MSKERLEEIKEIHKKATEAYFRERQTGSCAEGDIIVDCLSELFNEEHTDWLIEQAERADMLAHENMEIRKGYQERSKKVQELEEEINTHEPHGRNYTNEQYVKLRERAHGLEDLITGYRTELAIKDNANKRIKHKNKRYREMLKKAFKAEDLEDIWDIEDEYKAGEGEE